MNPWHVFSSFSKRIPWYVAAKVTLSLFFLVYATNLTITTTPYQAESGGRISFTNNLTAVDKGISKTLSNQTSAGTSCGPSGTNVTFTSGVPQTANTTLIANDYVYSIQVNTTAITATSSCFTVTLTVISGGGSSTYVLHLATGSTMSSDETVTCKFDIGPSLPTSPYSFSVAVQ